MIYVLYGPEEFLINEEIKKIKNDNNIDDYNVSYYNLENIDIKDIIDDALMISLFQDKKMIVVENTYIFTGIKKEKNQSIDYLEKYLDNINDDTILIFKVINEKLDSRKKIITKLNKVALVREFNNISINETVKKMFEPYNIGNIEINHFLNRVGNDLYIIDNEVKKIKGYKDNDLNITKQDIDILTVKSIDTDIFHLIDNIILNKKDEALESYHEMIKQGEEPIKLIVMLANQFRLIYQVKELYKRGYREYDIANILEQKPYPIKKASEKMHKYSSEELLNYLVRLADLDINIKTGKIDKNLGLELFILGA